MRAPCRTGIRRNCSGFCGEVAAIHDGTFQSCAAKRFRRLRRQVSFQPERRACGARACCGSSRAPGPSRPGSSGAPRALAWTEIRSSGGTPVGRPAPDAPLATARRVGAIGRRRSAATPPGGRSSGCRVWPGRRWRRTRARSRARARSPATRSGAARERVGREAQRAAGARRRRARAGRRASGSMSSRRSRSGGSSIGNDPQPIVEVLAEACPRATARAQVAVGRGDDARVGPARPASSPTRSYVALLQDAQQLHLQVRAACRRSRRGRACRRWRARIGPTGRAIAPVNAPRTWPKSSLSRSSPGSAAALTATNGPLRARRVGVDGAREHLLAGSALAGDEDARLAVLQRLDEPQNTRAMAGERQMSRRPGDGPVTSRRLVLGRAHYDR